jgi:hypothetical protein
MSFRLRLLTSFLRGDWAVFVRLYDADAAERAKPGMHRVFAVRCGPLWGYPEET